MSIHDQTGQARTITEGWRALELFTNRRKEIRLFASYLNDDPRRESILCFHGDGGNGKSLLLRYLRERFCKRVDPSLWQQLRALSDQDLAARLEKAATERPVPSALVDFGMQPRGEDRPQEGFSALLMLHRELSSHGLHFPLFDYGCVWYLHKTEQLTGEKLASLFPDEEATFLSALLDVGSQSAWGSLVTTIFKVAGKWLGKTRKIRGLQQKALLFLKERKIDAALVEAIQRMDPERELMDNLPRFFATDLNAAMQVEGAPPRVVLLFDTHEAFWGERRALSRGAYFLADEWLRCLLGSLELNRGIVAVVAGREAPRWAEAEKFPIPSQFLDVQLIGHLSEADGDQYLLRAGVADTGMRRAVLDFAKVGPDQVHPLYLGFCADVLLAAARRGMPLGPEDFAKVPATALKGRELLGRLLRYVDSEVDCAVTALCACRAFDKEIYFKLARVLDFQGTEAAFQLLTGFSFVWRAETPSQGWYRIHNLVRRLTFEEESKTKLVRKAHAILEEHYQDRANKGDAAALAETIFYANCQDWRRGIEAWKTAFEQALEKSQYDRCRTLLEVRSDLTIEDDFERGMVSQAEGDFYLALARHDEARLEFLEAISAFDSCLKASPDDLSAHNSKGNALHKLGELHARLAQHVRAQDNYQQAIAAYDEALRVAPENASLYNNKGSALQNLGELQARFAQHAEAQASYEKAIAAHNEALRLAPEDVSTHNNKGNALQSLGKLQAGLAQHIEAQDNYQQAIAAYDEALRVAPENASLYNNKGSALYGLGELQARFAQHAEAQASYEKAIATHNEALRRAPNNVYAHNNKGIALCGLGQLQAGLTQHAEALDSYQGAIAAYDEALGRAPDDVYAHNNKGMALLSLGDLQAGLAQHAQAEDSYRKAIAAHNEALGRAPNNVSAHNSKGNTLLSLGNLQAGLAQHAEAQDSYQRAIADYEEALRRAPDYVSAHSNKGLALMHLGDLYLKLEQPDQALTCLERALVAYENVLERAPNNLECRKKRDWILEGLAEIERLQHEQKEAE